MDVKNVFLAYLRTKTQENKFAFHEKETYANSLAYNLAWVQSLWFSKTSKDPNCFIKENQCQSNRHFGRHTSNGSRIERKFANKGDIFLFNNWSFVLNFKKVAGNKVKEKTFLGLVINSVT